MGVVPTVSRKLLAKRARDMLAIDASSSNVQARAGEDIAHARSGGAADALDNLITLFALKVTRSRAEISDADLTAARQGGLDDGLIVEIIANVAMNVMTNYLNRVADTEIDFPLVELKDAA